MKSESATLGKYRLYSNKVVKVVFCFGIFLQVATLALAIAMISLGGWIEIYIETPGPDNDRYANTRSEGLMRDCYPEDSPIIAPDGHFHTVSKCYTKNFGQYTSDDITPHQKGVAIAGAVTVCLGLLISALVIVTGLHLAFIWFKATYDSYYVRSYRLFVGFLASIASCLYLASIVIFHVGLRLSTEKIPFDQMTSTEIRLENAYYVAWACVCASILSAWVILASTSLWSLDYVQEHSLAAAFEMPHSQRNSTMVLSTNPQGSIYSINQDGLWSIQDPPTLPRYYTSTYGDGSHIRNLSESQHELPKDERAVDVDRKSPAKSEA